MGNKWLDWYWNNGGYKDKLYWNKQNHVKCTCGGHSWNLLDKKHKGREIFIRSREWTDDLIAFGLRPTEEKLRRLGVMIRYKGKPKPKRRISI